LTFKLDAPYQPAGDQPEAIRQIVDGLKSGVSRQTLLGVTGSGKTFTMANIIKEMNVPTLVFSHNKTLAAQLYNEFKSFFPHNAVEYFVSYYDYYQPEAYIPHTDTYIDKDSSRNEEIDRLRLKATMSLLSRRDVIIVASVSCIYGLGSPKEYDKHKVTLKCGQNLERDLLLRSLVDIQYTRNDMDLPRGTFRVRGDTVDIHTAYDDDIVRIEMFGDEIEKITRCHNVTQDIIENYTEYQIFPATHFVTPIDEVNRAVKELEKELDERLLELRLQNKLVEAQRLEQRTNYDLEMIKEIGYCSGIENYSRVFDGRAAGSKPYTLLDYFPSDYLMFIDESHVTVPQIGAMYKGDRSRKNMLVDYGFRLPCALDNRPLKFPEFEEMLNKVVFVSATPAEYELKASGGVYVEQVVRPTGLLDPIIEIQPVKNQIDHLIGQIRDRLSRKERVLVTTLTKKMAEDLTSYLSKADIPVRYLHSDIDTLERSEIIRAFRRAEFEVLIGINLLREGLDIPEVSLVAILDADKEGFLRSERSLIQTIGRASRNINGKVILYADRITDSMRKAIDETDRRRSRQAEHNKLHGIEPKSTTRKIEDSISVGAPIRGKRKVKEDYTAITDILTLTDLMNIAASELEFERAAKLRDRIRELEDKVRNE
jgi:excinuclease ABC subunit B